MNFSFRSVSLSPPCHEYGTWEWKYISTSPIMMFNSLYARSRKKWYLWQTRALGERFFFCFTFFLRFDLEKCQSLRDLLNSRNPNSDADRKRGRFEAWKSVSLLIYSAVSLRITWIGTPWEFARFNHFEPLEGWRSKLKTLSSLAMSLAYSSCLSV